MSRNVIFLMLFLQVCSSSIIIISLDHKNGVHACVLTDLVDLGRNVRRTVDAVKQAAAIKIIRALAAGMFIERAVRLW